MYERYYKQFLKGILKQGKSETPFFKKMQKLTVQENIIPVRI